MELTRIRDRQVLADYFRQDIALHFYSLGDLDDFYWPNTTCFGVNSPGGVSNVAMLYKGQGLPVLLLFDKSTQNELDYIPSLIPLLPDHFYAHLSPGLEERFSESHLRHNYGDHIKMDLQDPSQLYINGEEKIVPLSSKDLPEMIDLYDLSYPENAFDQRMVLSGVYYGYRESGQLISIGGIHVYSQRFNVAALGNITTHPDYRNQGLGKQVTSRICRELSKSVDFIGLNVKADNRAAIHLYQSLGFTISAKYGEFSFKKRP